MSVIATIILLGVLIFVHELGHFLAARSVGVGVERFSIGLGPRIAGFRRGGTEYVISAIPLGGYVKLSGMNDEVMEYIEGGSEAEGEPGSGEDSPGEAGPTEAPAGGMDGDEYGNADPGDFDSRPVWARAWVISAGVIMNMIFAFVVYAAVAGGWGSPEVDTTHFAGVRDGFVADARGFEAVPSGAWLVRIGDRELSHWGDVREALTEGPAGEVTVSFRDPEGQAPVMIPVDEEERRRMYLSLHFWSEPVVQSVAPGGPADQAGIRRGDRIVAVDGEALESWPRFVEAIQTRPGTQVELTLLRDGGELYRTVTPDEVEAIHPVTGDVRAIGQIGVASESPGVAYSPETPLNAVRAGWDETVFVTGFILGVLRDLVTGQLSPRNLGSIVAIGEMSGQAAAEGIPTYLRFMALFSINLAILNLLPIPVLDGGHLVFLGIEAVRGRPLSVEQRVRWSHVGFVVLIGIMALALGNDLLRIFGL
jgi:regulator of sigma E protease